MTAPFTPAADRPKWELVYDILRPLNIGDVITYERLSEALDRDFKADRSPFYKAAQRWGQENHRALRPVPGVGYRVVDAPEHEPLARAQHRRSKRALRRSRMLIETADRSRLSESDRQRFDAMEQTLSRHEDVIRRIDIRTTKVEKALKDSRREQVATQAELARLKESLRRHGIDPDSSGAAS